MASSSNSGRLEDHRRKWDKEEYERLAKERVEQERAERDGDKKPKEKVRREMLKPRDYRIDLESKVGKSVVITKTTAASESGGYYCNVCDCVVKDSINFLDHINGKKHQRNMGMSMKVKKSTLDDVRARLAAKKQQNEEQKKEYDIEERVKELQEEEQKLAEYRKQKRQDLKKRKRPTNDDDDEFNAPSEFASMMGFSGFGSSKKYFHSKMKSCTLLAVLALLLSLANCEKQMSLEEKVNNLQEMISRRPVIRLNGDKFKQYVRSAPRNYSIIVTLTALSASRGCSICRQAYDEFEIVANSYRYAYMYSKQLYFAVADFDEASDVFSSLNINSAPVLIHFPAKGGRKKADTMDISRMGFHAEAIAKFIQDRTDVHIRVLRPPNYAGPTAFILLFILIGGLLYMKRNNLDFLYNRTMWGIAALCIIFAFLSGQMWNHIRGPPFMHRNPQTGQMSYISGSSQMQFVVETYIVMVMYAAVTVGFILLNEAVDIKGDATKKRVMACVGLGIVVVFFSLLLSVFRSKYQGYPYR